MDIVKQFGVRRRLKIDIYVFPLKKIDSVYTDSNGLLTWTLPETLTSGYLNLICPSNINLSITDLRFSRDPDDIELSDSKGIDVYQYLTWADT